MKIYEGKDLEENSPLKPSTADRNQNLEYLPQSMS